MRLLFMWHINATQWGCWNFRHRDYYLSVYLNVVHVRLEISITVTLTFSSLITYDTWTKYPSCFFGCLTPFFLYDCFFSSLIWGGVQIPTVNKKKCWGDIIYIYIDIFGRKIKWLNCSFLTFTVHFVDWGMWRKSSYFWRWRFERKWCGLDD